MLFFHGALIAQATANGANIQSIWDFCLKGGPVMIPIGICSLVALTVVIERLISLQRRRVIPPGFLAGLQAMLRGARDVPAALDYCQKSQSPVGNVFAAGIKRMGEPVELLEKHIEEAGQREIMKLRKYLRLLSLISSIATLLGLLGTIFGMITAFQTVAASGEALGKTELLAKGIYEALITTAAGLIVSIPVMIAYHGLAAKIDGLVAEIDALSVDFVEEFARPKGASMAAAAIAMQSAASNNGPGTQRLDAMGATA